MTLVIIMIAILPTVAQRTKTPDNLPALYFYGNAKTGKNYLFKQHAAYHNVPTIHTRVSRYNQQINETGFFLKDLNSDTLIDPLLKMYKDLLYAQVMTHTTFWQKKLLKIITTKTTIMLGEDDS